MVALVALAVGAFVAIGSSGDEGVALPEPFSLAAAAQNTIDARSVEFELTVSAGDLGDVAVVGAVDNETNLVSVSTDLSALLALDAAMPIGDGAIELLFDPSTDVIYISAAALGDLLPGDSAWVSADLGALAEKSGTTIDEMQNELFVDPAEWARALLDSDDVVEVGSEIIDGVDTVHYEVTVDVAAAVAESPRSDLGSTSSTSTCPTPSPTTSGSPPTTSSGGPRSKSRSAIRPSPRCSTCDRAISRSTLRCPAIRSTSPACSAGEQRRRTSMTRCACLDRVVPPSLGVREEPGGECVPGARGVVDVGHGDPGHLDRIAGSVSTRPQGPGPVSRW